MTLWNPRMHLALLAWSLLTAGPAPAQEKPAPLTSPLKTPASGCKLCHPQHYQEWEQSFHSKTVVAMHAGFKKYITTQEQAKGRPLNRNELLGCLGCHAPAMQFADDSDFARLVTLVKTDQREALAGLSVDCVACHALYGSGQPDKKPPEGMTRQTYYGTLQNPAKSPHGAQFAPQMAKSEFCKSCHTYVTPAHLKLAADWDIICSLTYDSWAESPYGPKAAAANRKECQSCHMEKRDGRAAALPGLQTPTRKVSSHLFPGWHDPGTLQRATQLSLATRPGAPGGSQELVVTIDNQAGHRIPDT